MRGGLREALVPEPDVSAAAHRVGWEADPPARRSDPRVWGAQTPPRCFYCGLYCDPWGPGGVCVCDLACAYCAAAEVTDEQGRELIRYGNWLATHQTSFQPHVFRPWPRQKRRVVNRAAYARRYGKTYEFMPAIPKPEGPAIIIKIASATNWQVQREQSERWTWPCGADAGEPGPPDAFGRRWAEIGAGPQADKCLGPNMTCNRKCRGSAVHKPTFEQALPALRREEGIRDRADNELFKEGVRRATALREAAAAGRSQVGLGITLEALRKRLGIVTPPGRTTG